MKTGGIVVTLAALMALTLVSACNSNLNLRAGETLVNAKARNLDGLKVYIADVVDNRSLTDRVGARQDITGQEIWVYAAEPPVSKQVHTALSKGFKAAGAEVVSDADSADFQVKATVVAFRVTAYDIVLMASTDGEVALDITYLDGKGFEVGSRSFHTPFERKGIDPDIISEHFRTQVAEAVAEADVVAGEAKIVATLDNEMPVASDGHNTGGAASAPNTGEDGADEDDEPVGNRRVFLRFAASKKQLKTFESKGVYFQGLVLEAGGTEFAGTSEMDAVYTSLCSDMGVAADEERQCRLQAARRLFVDDVIHLEAHKAGKQWEVTMQVWNPETNGMIAAKAVKLDASSLGTAAELALPTLACSYLRHRKIEISSCAGL